MKEDSDERLKRPPHQTNAFKNPCAKEEAMSYKCLDENNFDREKCAIYFANYTKCQEFWTKIRAERRAKGIKPYLPFPEERERIKAEYMKSKEK
ncbi:hypothetical protein J437_LFUL001100 [Ladona fulva]|uniref:Coiled-coil-helix-coiled-coil-helix domain-containing protein 7 n=1 Tax=Ladona fulva TaxID=123851 RepID=A0A8K0K138_LADFU|nr:hypothetical protein J437_LFUL001100 [Ladona fulva]